MRESPIFSPVFILVVGFVMIAVSEFRGWPQTASVAGFASFLTTPESLFGLVIVAAGVWQLRRKK
jgi:hypothetical protein